MTHVLIVEDHEENRNFLKMLLEANGYRVTAAGDGLEALAAAQRDPPDAIVSDALMPRMDGFALCRAWMQDLALKSIPFIFYSATYVRSEDAQFATALGAVRYLIKPLEAEVFLGELRAVLQQWAGHTAPAPAAPLDDLASHALHESALARKVEDKLAQLEAAKRELQESEARFRSLTGMSSDFYWESDAEHRLTQRGSATKKGALTVFRRPTNIGERRWDIPCLTPDEAGWRAHRAVLDARQPFRDFEFSRLGNDGTERFISISGDPVFDAAGAFTGYRGVGTDITERKRAEITLRESESSFRSLFERMLNGFAYCRMLYDDRDRPVDFVYLKVNDAFERLTGLKNVVGRNVSEVIPGIRELSPELFEAYGRVASSGIAEAFEFDFKSMAKWLTISVYSPQKGHFVAIFDDITERKRAEEALRARELRYQAVTTSATDAFVTSDATGRIVGWNPSAARIFGYMETEVIGQPLTLLIPQRFHERHLDGMKRVQAGGERRVIGKTVELAGRRKDASEFPLELSLGEWTVGEGQFFTGIIRDITERKKSEAGLKLFRALIDQSNDAIEVLDPDTLRFLDVNQKGCLALGYSREELLSLSALDIDPMIDRSTVRERIERLRISGSNIIESRHRRKDGSEFPVEVSLRYVRLDRDYVLTIARDTTERKAAEAQIQRLTQLYAALSQCNQAIVRCASEEELFPEICRVAVQFGGMKMAWIGNVDPDTRMVRIAASFGDHADEYLQGIEISVDADHPRGRGPTGTAIRENRPVWRQDFGNQPLLAPWQERRARFGFGASATLPLHRNGVTVGVLTLYAGEVGAFDEATRNLLVEMATDIGFALDNFAREAARARAEIGLRAAEEQFRGLVEQSIAGIYLIQDGKFAYVNPRFAEIFGYASSDELIGRESLSLVTEKDRSVVLDMRRQVEGEVQSKSYAFTGVRRDGAEIDVGVHSTRATHNGRPALIGLAQDISEKKRAEEQIQRYSVQIENAFMSTVQVVTTLGEMRDPYTGGHQRKAAEIAVAIGAELGFDARRLEGLRVAGYLHDIGKIMIPSEILSKPGKLSATEFQLVQGHAQASYDVLKDVSFPWPVAEVALQHHERMDGSGYPRGLKGEAILFEARIMAVADVFEAMSSHRPYRAGLGIEAALTEIERGRGSAYDAEVADACLRLFREGRFQLPV